MACNKKMARIIIIDDDEVCCSVLARLLAREGKEVEWFTTGKEALDRGLEKEPQLLICDWILENGLDGVDVARAIWNRWSKVRIIFITGLPADQLRRETHELPVIHVFEKPLPLDDLLTLVDPSIENGP